VIVCYGFCRNLAAVAQLNKDLPPPINEILPDAGHRCLAHQPEEKSIMPDTGLDAASTGRHLGVLVVGLGGAVASTAVAGIEMLRAGSNDLAGLPLANIGVAGLAPYRNIHFAGWDLHGEDLAEAVKEHRVLDREQTETVEGALSTMKPWPAVGSRDFCKNVDGSNKINGGHRDAVEQIRTDIRTYRETTGVRNLVMVNLASVERWPDLTLEVLQTPAAFEHGLDGNDPAISPAMLYAYASIMEGVPYGNFTPSLAADIPALTRLADERCVPVAGKDGKTGQTFIKTVLAPAFRSRSLYVEGWFSTNILGNRDGLALDNADSLRSKLNTKGSVLDQILGYPVEDHLVNIQYYKPRGDNKEAWDNIDLVGFMGQKMQMKVNFLCRDSILAAPLVIEIARVLDLAKQRGNGGIQEQLGIFFKAPMTPAGRREEHSFPVQERVLLDWLSAA
jgi:myo-inositol-1-phosphate synthase